MPKTNPLYLHVKTGNVYELLIDCAYIEATGVKDATVVYQDYPEGNRVWVRPRKEFFDGRFQELGQSAEAQVFDPLADVLEFHEKFELDGLKPMGALDPELFAFRKKFLQEELDEWAKNQALAYDETTKPILERDIANYNYHLEESLDGLVDLMYVLLGTAHFHGFAEVFAEAWRRVHQANMSKVRADLDGSNSKRDTALDVVKPAGWEKPDHSDLVECNDIHSPHSDRA